MTNNELLKIYKQSLKESMFRAVRKNARLGSRVTKIMTGHAGWTKNDVGIIQRALNKSGMKYRFGPMPGMDPNAPVDPTNAVLYIMLSGDSVRSK